MDDRKLLDSRVAAVFYGRFPELRPAQAAAISPLLDGRNVVLSSGTGSGKTEAVVAPLVNRYQRSAAEKDSLTFLYVAPTKALVNDLEKRLRLPLDALGLRVGVRHGDRDDLASGPTPHFLITTPESFDVLLFRRDPALISLRAIVLDEVHLLYNTQRGLHLSILIHRLRARTGHTMQWAALSATVGRLPDIRDFLFGTEEDAVFLQFPAHRQIDAQVRHIPNETAFLSLIRRLTEARRVKLLIFANSRRECERLAGVLDQDKKLHPVIFAHYSSLSHEMREETERRFAASGTAVCIATSTLELGIDIGDIDAVVLWGVPGSVESFLQRIGRGNRRSNKTNVICLIPDTAAQIEMEAIRFLTLVKTARLGELPARTPYELFGALAQQCLNVIASENGRFTRVADLCQVASHQRHLDRPRVEDVLDELSARGYLQAHGFKNRYGAGDHLYSLQDYRLIYGNFPAGSQTVEVRHSFKVLASVPVINLLRVRRGSFIRLGGKRWQVRALSGDGIQVEPMAISGDAIDFTYSGRGMRFDPFLADRLWELLHSEEFPSDLLSTGLLNSVVKLKATINELFSVHQIPNAKVAEGHVYLTFAGTMVNKAVGLITGQSKFKVDDISLLATIPIDWQSIPTDVQAYQNISDLLFESPADQSLYQELLPKHLQLHELTQDWIKDENIPRILSRLANATPINTRSEIIKCFTSIVP